MKKFVCQLKKINFGAPGAIFVLGVVLTVVGALFGLGRSVFAVLAVAVVLAVTFSERNKSYSRKNDDCINVRDELGAE